MTWLVRVTAPHYCAGLVLDTSPDPADMGGFAVVQSAPILRWARGRRWPDVVLGLRKKGYGVEIWPDEVMP